jgi:hypothetical protein
MGVIVMGDHEVKVSGFVRLVAAVLLESGAYALFTGDNIPVLPAIDEVRSCVI